MTVKPPKRSASRKAPSEPHHRVEVCIDVLLAERGLTLTQLADEVGLTLANLSVLKNGRARAIRFTTLTAVCDVLRCQPGDLLRVTADDQIGSEETAAEEQAAHRDQLSASVST